MNEIITAGLGKLDWRDLLHGLYMAIGGAIGSSLLQWSDELSKGHFLILDYKAIGFTALSAGIAYIVKKLFTPAKTIVINK